MRAARCLLLGLLVVLTACQSVPASGTPAPLFLDEFSDPASGWPEAAGADGSLGYQNGAYQIQVEQPEYDLWALPERSYRDVTIEVDTERLSGPLSNRFGLICRARDQENFYFFIISSDGYYAIGKVVAGVRTLVGQEMMAFTSAIDQQAGRNRLRFDCVDEVLTGSINGQVVAITVDGSFSSGRTGLLAGSFDEPGVVIAFDHYVLTAP